MPRCPRCAFFHTALGAEACTQAVPVQHDAGPPMLLHQRLPRREQKRPTEQPRGKPAQWSREQIVRAGQAWVQAHPGLLLQTEHLKARYGLPTITVIRKHFGHISRYRELLGLPTGRAPIQRVRA